MSTAHVEWKRQREGGWNWLLRAYAWLLLRLGRGFALVILVIICSYFLLVRRYERRASRDYLRRVLGRQPRTRDVARHFWTFARAAMDRAYLLGAADPPLEVTASGLDELDAALARGRGVLLLGAHYGSFEAARLVGLGRPDVKLRVVMDRHRNTNINALIERLNPGLAGQIIDVGSGGDHTVLAIKEALDTGAPVGMLADRCQPRERRIAVQFLGQEAWLPQAPYLIAAVTGVPVLLLYGVFEGGNRYHVRFELLADRIDLPRGNREGAMAHWAQAYATRLEQRVRDNPWNWFNFYDFWRS